MPLVCLLKHTPRLSSSACAKLWIEGTRRQDWYFAGRSIRVFDLLHTTPRSLLLRFFFYNGCCYRLTTYMDFLSFTIISDLYRFLQCSVLFPSEAFFALFLTEWIFKLLKIVRFQQCACLFLSIDLYCLLLCDIRCKDKGEPFRCFILFNRVVAIGACLFCVFC